MCLHASQACLESGANSRMNAGSEGQSDLRWVAALQQGRRQANALGPALLDAAASGAEHLD